MKALLLLALVAVPVAPGVVSYRTPDGVEHFVGSLADVPPAYRRVSRSVDLSGAPLNFQLERDLEDQSRREGRTLEKAGAAQRHAQGEKKIPGWLPGYALLLEIAGIAGAASLLLWLLYQSWFEGSGWANRGVVLGVVVASLAVALIAARFIYPEVDALEQRLSRFSIHSLRAEKDRDADVLRANMDKAARKAAGLDDDSAGARPPPRPGWSGAPPPEGLLHH